MRVLGGDGQVRQVHRGGSAEHGVCTGVETVLEIRVGRHAPNCGEGQSQVVATDNVPGCSHRGNALPVDGPARDSRDPMPGPERRLASRSWYRVPSAEQTLGQERLASTMCAPASAAHAGHCAKSAARSSAVPPAFGEPTTDTMSRCPSSRAAAVRRTSPLQRLGSTEGIPKHTAELAVTRFSGGPSRTHTGPSGTGPSSTNTQSGMG